MLDYPVLALQCLGMAYIFRFVYLLFAAGLVAWARGTLSIRSVAAGRSRASVLGYGCCECGINRKTLTRFHSTHTHKKKKE